MLIRYLRWIVVNAFKNVWEIFQPSLVCTPPTRTKMLRLPVNDTWNRRYRFPFSKMLSGFISFMVCMYLTRGVCLNISWFHITPRRSSRFPHSLAAFVYVFSPFFIIFLYIYIFFFICGTDVIKSTGNESGWKCVFI